MRILHSDTGVNTLISLKTGGASQVRVLVREYQVDPVTSHLLHADFYRVAMDKKLTVTVPIVVRGEAPGVKQQGGVSTSYTARWTSNVCRLTFPITSTSM